MMPIASTRSAIEQLSKPLAQNTSIAHRKAASRSNARGRPRVLCCVSRTSGDMSRSLRVPAIVMRIEILNYVPIVTK
ncbi:protein of unknown function (plasmid) [Caballeronia sp. S22]